MNQINYLKDSSFKSNKKNDINKELKNQIIENNLQPEKVLCNHCGRTTNNGIRCLGICVADNDY